jgi:hypothetical protein
VAWQTGTVALESVHGYVDGLLATVSESTTEQLSQRCHGDSKNRISIKI